MQRFEIGQFKYKRYNIFHCELHYTGFENMQTGTEIRQYQTTSKRERCIYRGQQVFSFHFEKKREDKESIL